MHLKVYGRCFRSSIRPLRPKWVILQVYACMYGISWVRVNGCVIQEIDVVNRENNKMTNSYVSQKITEILFEAMSELLDSVRLVKETCTPEDAAAFNRGARQIICQMGKMLSLISSIDPIESPYPDKPQQRNPLVENIDTAQRVAEVLFQVSSSLTESLNIVRNAVPEDTFKTYALGVGETLTEIMYEFLNPIFAMHPSIEPKNWK